MSALLVLTVGQTDVKLVEEGTRRDFSKRKCAALHDEIERRVGDWQLVETPSSPAGKEADSLPIGTFSLCTPKLDAVFWYLSEHDVALTTALVFETRRDAKAEPSDPRYAGSILAARLREHGVTDVRQVAYLVGSERLEDSEHPRDAVIRRDVVQRIDRAVRNCLAEVDPARVFVLPTGGMPAASSLVVDIVRLHASTEKIDVLGVADGAKETPPRKDRAVSRQWTPEPAVSYRARRHALDLVERGNLLGAWGAVQHLRKDEVEGRWIRMIEWLACFSASMPMPPDCDIAVLTDRRMAVRAGLRVELALRLEDIPRAVHGTVAFFESALWDHLRPHLTRHEDPKKRWYTADPAPDGDLVRHHCPSSEDHRKPFEVADSTDAVVWYRVFDDDVRGIRLAKHYLKQAPLQKLGQAVSQVRDLRNDVAHNEPTPQLMDDARVRMVETQLWSADGTFLKQPLVQDVLRNLGEPRPEELCTRLVSTIRERLLTPNGPDGAARTEDESVIRNIIRNRS